MPNKGGTRESLLQDFETQLKYIFLDDVTRMLAEAEQCVLSFESNPSDSKILDAIFRLAHNIKGNASAVGFNDLGHFTHEFESLLLKIMKGEIRASRALVSLLLKCSDHIRTYVDHLRADFNARLDSSELLQSIRGWTAGATPVPVKPPEQSVIRAEVRKSGAGEENIRVSFARLEKLLNFVGEMVILNSVLREQVAALKSAPLTKTVDQLGKVTKEVQELSMGMRMVPLKATFQKMHRIVRDTASTLHKKVDLVIRGEDVEVDKTVLEQIGDPLVHLIRNAVDHGLEAYQIREDIGKPEVGRIYLSAFHLGGQLIIQVRDDGAGLNATKLVTKAKEKGLLAQDQALSDRDAYNLIFTPGFSTRSEVSDISGRGVGMDVVRTNIEALQGQIDIETKLGEGTCFTIKLPLTLAIIDGMVVTIAGQRYVIPLSHIHETVRPFADEIKAVTGLGNILLLRGENIQLVNLKHILFGGPEEEIAEDAIAILVRRGEKPFAALVDGIVGQQQVVIKALGRELDGIRGYSGSAILGDGRPALILELDDLVSKNEKRRTA